MNRKLKVTTTRIDANNQPLTVIGTRQKKKGGAAIELGRATAAGESKGEGSSN